MILFRNQQSDVLPTLRLQWSFYISKACRHSIQGYAFCLRRERRGRGGNRVAWPFHQIEFLLQVNADMVCLIKCKLKVFSRNQCELATDRYRLFSLLQTLRSLNCYSFPKQEQSYKHGGKNYYYKNFHPGKLEKVGGKLSFFAAVKECHAKQLRRAVFPTCPFLQIQTTSAPDSSLKCSFMCILLEKIIV